MIPGWITGIPGLLRVVPRWVWIALAVGVAAGIMIVGHQRAMHAALEEAHKRGVDETNTAWQARLEEAHREAERWRTRFAQAQDQISQGVATRNAQNALRIGAAADALRLRGPGAAAPSCPRPVDHSPLAGATGGRDAPARRADASGSGVPEEDRATVPWSTWLVPRTAECDLNRAEAASWREWNAAEQRRLNEAMRSAGGQP